MSVRLHFEKGTLVASAVLKDAALGELLRILAEHYEEPAEGKPFVPFDGIDVSLGREKAPGTLSQLTDRSDSVREWLSKHAASEVLNQLRWETFPERILLLGAHLESVGGEEGWRSRDILKKFDEAKENSPTNFPRDISVAIKSNLVAAVTPRTYKVGRQGWKKIGEGVAGLGG